MSVRTGQSITKVFTTRVFATGVATNADSTPTGTLYVNGTADAASVTVTNVATGIYKAQVTMPTLAVGDVVDLRIAATVSSVSDGDIIWSDTKDIAADSAGKVPATIAAGDLATDSITAAALKADAVTEIQSGLMTSAGYTAPNNSGISAIQTALGAAGAGLTALGDTRLANLDAAVSSRLATSGYTAPDNATITAINAKTTNLPASPASTTNITSATGVTLASSQTFTNTSSSNQTGDAFARIGAAGAGLTSLGDTRLANLDAAVSTRLATSGYTAPDNTGIASAASSASSAASSASTAATQATNAATQTTAGNIRAAVGLSAANLDTQIGDLPTNAELTTAITALLTTQMTEAYAADGAAPTLAQCLFLIQQSLHEFSITGTARTVKKLDGSTTAAVFTLDSATSPTSTTRTT